MREMEQKQLGCRQKHAWSHTRSHSDTRTRAHTHTETALRSLAEWWWAGLHLEHSLVIFSVSMLTYWAGICVRVRAQVCANEAWAGGQLQGGGKFGSIRPVPWLFFRMAGDTHCGHWLIQADARIRTRSHSNRGKTAQPLALEPFARMSL